MYEYGIGISKENDGTVTKKTYLNIPIMCS